MLTTETLAVNLLLVSGLVLFTRDAAPRRTWARLGAVLLLDGLTCAYVHWRYTSTLPAFDWEIGSLWAWFFFVCEMVAIVYELWSLFVLVRLTDHSATADRYERRLRQAHDLPTVDVFIPTYSEGAEILEETIRAALNLDYPRDKVRIHMLDDSRRPWLKELCARYGVGYFARPTNEHGKAGNLNYAFPRTHGEYILVIDADFLLHKDFIYRTLGFLVYEKGIGLVQTPQHFRNPDPIQHNLLGGKAWTEEQHFFMTMVESGRDSYGNAFCVGSGWIVQRAILAELGGFPQGSICEDLEITYVLKARGWRTLFLNEPLAVGLAPESVPEYIKQRVRWCSGTMQHLYLASGPIRARGLSILDRLFYLESVIYWLTYPFIVLLLLSPIIFWFTGVAAIQGGGEEIFRVLIPRLLASYILIYWMSEWKVVPPVAMIHRTLSCFYITATLVKSFISPFGSPFKVTAKGQSRDGVVIQWKILRMFLILGALLMAGMSMNLTGYHQVVLIHDLTTLDVIWSLYSLIVLGLCVVVCIELPKTEGYLNAESEVRHGSARQSVLAVLRRMRGRLP